MNLPILPAGLKLYVLTPFSHCSTSKYFTVFRLGLDYNLEMLTESEKQPNITF